MRDAALQFLDKANPMGSQTTRTTTLMWEKDYALQDVCQHGKVREIGQDFDKEGKLLRLIRCQDCGLLMREYLPSL
jgi:hypothetical protein